MVEKLIATIILTLSLLIISIPTGHCSDYLIDRTVINHEQRLSKIDQDLESINKNLDYFINLYNDRITIINNLYKDMNVKNEVFAAEYETYTKYTKTLFEGTASLIALYFSFIGVKSAINKYKNKKGS